MSLIACTLNYDKPFIIGDLLITSSLASESISLPTNLININQYLKPINAYPIDLLQKIYIIKRNVCLALAGSLTEMQHFLKEFTIRCSYFNDDDFEESHIHDFIKGYDLKRNFSESAFFILRMKNDDNKKIKVGLFWYPETYWKNIQSDIFQEVYACGSGKEDFLNQITSEAKVHASTEKGNILRAISFNIGFLAKILAFEKSTLHTIKYKWGGGFETILFDGHSFIKFDEIAYIINIGYFDVIGKLDFPAPKSILYYKYHNELLLIISLEIHSFEHNEINNLIEIISTDFSSRLFIVPRIDQNDIIAQNDLPVEFSFQTNRIAVGYSLITQNNVILNPSYFLEDPESSVTFTNNKTLKIIIKSDVSQQIKNGAEEVYPNL